MARVRLTEPEPLVAPKVVGAFLGDIAEQTLANWRSAGTGPPWHKIGGQVRYRISEVDAWVEAQRLDAGDRSQDPIRRELTYRRDKRLEAK